MRWDNELLREISKTTGVNEETIRIHAKTLISILFDGNDEKKEIEREREESL